MPDVRLDKLIAENTQFFFGTVVASDAATYSVQVAPISNHMPALLSGTPLTSVMASMIGVKECFLPQPASTVFCFKYDAYACLILGVVPEFDQINKAEIMHARATLGVGDSNSVSNNDQGYVDDSGVSKLVTANANRPTDVVEGEYVLANEFGVLLGLFQHFASLKASELAQIQMFIYDDLVRIVSHNFEHFTCMGGSKIYQDNAKLTQEINLTHDSMEAVGRPNVTGKDFPPVIELTGKTSTDDTEDFFKLDNEKRIAIDRFKGFVGALGDFMHLIFSRPAEQQLRSLDGTKTGVYDRGLSSVKMNMDGSVALRSLGGVAIEKTNWIRVPHRIKAVEEKETFKPEDVKKLPGYKFDSSVKAGDLPFLQFLQLRDYLAYTMEGEAYSQFVNSDKFEVNTDPTLETKIGQDTQLTPDKTADYSPRSSGFYLMPNGGIMLRDAWGSSLVMEGGNIYIQPAKDLVMQPMRNLIGKVGHHVSVAAQKDLELSSSTGGFRLKTEQAQYLYSASSGIILHSDASSPSEYYPKDDMVTSVGGILLNAPKAGLATHSQFSLFKTDENTVIKSNLCMIDAESRILFRSHDGFDVFTTGDLLLSAGQNLVAFTEKNAVFVGLKETAIGIQDQTIAMSPMGPVEGLFKNDSFDKWRDQAANISTSDFQEYSFAYRSDLSFDALKFRFPSSGYYGLTEKVDVIPQTLAQQEHAKFENMNLTKWEEVGINDTYPYPGNDNRNCFATSNLTNLQFDQASRDTYNKAIEHSAVGQINFADLFLEYTVYA